MRSTDCQRLLVAVAAYATLTLGCTRPTPAPPAVRDNGTALSVFTDTAVYRRYCDVAADRPVDLQRPCFLRDQGRSVERPLPATRQPPFQP
jgi:hypothetical protein